MLIYTGEDKVYENSFSEEASKGELPFCVIASLFRSIGEAPFIGDLWTVVGFIQILYLNISLVPIYHLHK